MSRFLVVSSDGKLGFWLSAVWALAWTAKRLGLTQELDIQVLFRSLMKYANGVKYYSPGLRFCERSDAKTQPWVRIARQISPPLRFLAASPPKIGGEAKRFSRVPYPGLQCHSLPRMTALTLGYVVQRRWRKEQNLRRPFPMQPQLLSRPALATVPGNQPWLTPKRLIRTVAWNKSSGLILVSLLTCTTVLAQPSLSKSSNQVQNRVVKIYGAGGVGGLDAYQSGFVVSPAGHVATAWSSVLDVEPIVLLSDGRRFESKIVGFEPSLELAVLKLDTGDLPYFAVSETGPDSQANTNDSGRDEYQWGDPVLAVSNLFNIATGNEPASVLQGRLAARSELDARRGTFQTAYRGEVWLLDLVANNPGAAGGALVDLDGNLVGMLGKELRDRKTGVWLNYAIPADVLRGPIGDIIAGRKTVLPNTDRPLLARDKSHSMKTLGLGLIPDVLEMTPVYVDTTTPDSSAFQAGLQPDDLILLVEGTRVAHQRDFRNQLRRIDRRDDVGITIQRENEILELTLQP